MDKTEPGLPKTRSYKNELFISRIKLNSAFLKLGARNPNEAELELLMRRKEFLDEIHQVNLFYIKCKIIISKGSDRLDIVVKLRVQCCRETFRIYFRSNVFTEWTIK